MVEDMFDSVDDGEHKSSHQQHQRVPRRSTWLTVVVATALFVYDVFKTVATVLGVAFMIRFFLIQPFYVSGPSMEPNFHNNEYIIVDQVTYRFRTPHRGDVIVFKWPQNIAVSFIKRVIATPGETVEVRDGQVFIYNTKFPNGVLLNEPYINIPTSTNVKRTLGKDEYFVMGDNRNNSSDSRMWGPVARHLITGKVWVVIYPFEDFHTIPHPAYSKGL
jgi:signal peptidase I